MTWQLSSAEWIQEQGAFVRVASARTTKRGSRKVFQITNSDGRPLPGGIKYYIEILPAAPRRGPTACCLCDCPAFLPRSTSSTKCRVCGHAVKFHPSVGALERG